MIQKYNIVSIDTILAIGFAETYFDATSLASVSNLMDSHRLHKKPGNGVTTEQD
jgi:hypothetical protein